LISEHATAVSRPIPGQGPRERFEQREHFDGDHVQDRVEGEWHLSGALVSETDGDVHGAHHLDFESVVAGV
jgi:hypothetical protein